MPPKGAMSDRKRKEEEERKRLEEEQFRLQAEAEEKERLAKEKEQKRILKAIEKEELKKRVVELEETRELFKQQKIRLEHLELERRNDYEWKRYFRCDGSPNPSIEKEVNTFMSLWSMDEKRISMEEVIEDSVESLKLIDELRTLIADMGDNDEDNQKLTTYRRTMHELRQQVHEKLDRATVETLSRAVHYANHETSNLQKSWHNDWTVICIWGNLSKNPRIRQFTFSDVDITFDIPKILTLSDCAFLIAFMKFDNYSVECESYTPKRIPKSIVEKKSLHSSNSKVKITEKDNQIVEKNVEEVDNFDPFKDMRNEDEVEEQTVEQEDIVEIPPEDRIPTPDADEWERVEMAEDAVDLGDYHVVGGVIKFDLLTLPRQPRSGRGWTITTCVRPPKLCPFEYTVDEPFKISQTTAGTDQSESG